MGTGDLNDLSHDEFERLFGEWRGLRPAEVASLFRGAPFRWWIAGGWAIEAFTGVERFHEDTDVAVLKHDLAAVRSWLSSFHLWEAHDGTLRPLLAADELRPKREQLWMRRDAQSPWLLDILFTPSSGTTWLYKRDPQVRRPLDDIGFTTDGISYLKPEIAILFKAKLHRPKDDVDFDNTVPRLEPQARSWLVDSLQRTIPNHPWLARL